MMKKYKDIIIIVLGIIILFLLNLLNIHIPCIFHKLTGLYCPGCGVTRMILSLLRLDIYQAFRYNNLLFILSPLFVFLILEDFYSIYKNRKPLYLKINNKYYYIIIIILILFGIIRNIIPELGPVTI